MLLQVMIHSIKKRYSVYESIQIEKTLFGSETFIYDNTFSTTHQNVNIYTEPERKYEVRCEDIAIDVQMKD